MPAETPAAKISPRRRRRWWHFLGGCLAGALLIVGLLAVPAVQGWLLKRAVALRPDWHLEFQHFGAGPRGVEVRGLEFAMPGIEAKSAPIAIAFAPWRLLTGREFRIERAEAQKLRVTLTPAHLAPAAAPAATQPSTPAAPFSGALPLLQTPWPWALDAAHLDGEIVVNAGGQSVAIGAFRADGGGVAAGKTGEFTYDVTVNSVLLPPGPANKVHSHGVVRLAQAADRHITSLTVEGSLVLPAYGALTLPPGKFNLTITPSAGGEEYHTQLQLGAAATLDFTGHLDAARAQFAGHLALHADQTLAASLAGEKLPTATMQGAADLTLDLRTGDLNATLSGNLDARDWAKLMPQLAVVDAFKGHLTAALARHAGKISVHQFAATLQGEKIPAALRLELTQPVDPLQLPSTPFTHLTLAHVPLDWANPWLTSAQVQLAPAEFNGEWSLTALAGHRLRFTPAKASTLGPIALINSHLPSLPAVNVAFSPQLELSAKQATVNIDDFTATAAKADRVDGKLSTTFTFADHTLHTSGSLHGTLPTLLTGAERAVPFTLNAHWDVTQTGRQLRIDQLGFTARRDALTSPFVDLSLLQPLPLDLDHLSAATTGTPAEWLRLRFQHFPLGWLSRWLPGYTLGGELSEGESVLRSSADGSLTLASSVPWHATNASLAVGGRTLLEGEAQAAPALEFRAGRGTLHLAGLAAQDSLGNRVKGEITLEAGVADRKGSTTIALEADCPALPHTTGTFGPLHAALRAESHNYSDKIVIVDAFSLQVRNEQRDLFSLQTQQPFLFGLSNSGMFTVSTLAPLRLKVGELPLAWLRPWTGSLEFDGTLQPCDFALSAKNSRFLVRPAAPVLVRNFSARRDERDLVRETEFSFYPGLDLTLICVPQPKFQLAYSGTAHVTDGSLDVRGQHAAELDLAINFVGDTQRVLPNSLELSSRVDLAPLGKIAALAGRGLPPAGSLVLRANGGLLNSEPIEFWSRLDGVPAADGKRTLPALEVSAHGKISRSEVLTADVALNLASTPQPTDARFEAALNLVNGNLEIASGFHSTFFDAGEMLALAGAFQPKTPAKGATAPAVLITPATPHPAGPRLYQRLGHPFWGDLRGHFDLDIAALQFAPYRIDGVRGRLDLRDRELALSNLSGAMFAGRWSGQMRVDYQPDSPDKNHELTGEFRIEQFDSARVVQTVFPTELASVEASVDVRSTVHSRGNQPLELIDRAEASFTAEGTRGVVRLRVPKQDTMATAAVFGGAILLSPELRALGRLLKKFAEMPVDTLHVSGERTEAGEVNLRELRIQSPQARLVAHGRIVADEAEPLMNRQLDLSIDLSAKDETAVILGGMSLLRKKPDADGYRPMNEAFLIGGKAGQPDTRPLYDLLAKAVGGSKGTWGFLMRKMQDEVNKKKTAAPKKTAALTP